MQFTILGSGGYLRTPRPCCKCKLCKKARTDYSERRLGASIYYHEAKLLIDTPEDIAEALNFSNITEVKNIIYSHWHPDHMAGWRVVEQIKANIDYRSSSAQKNKNQIQNPINLWVQKEVLDNIKKYYPPILYMEKCGFINIRKFSKEIQLDNTLIKAIRINDIPMYAFVLKKQSKKTVVCMDHSKDIKLTDKFKKADCLIINMGHLKEDIPKNHIRNKDTSFKNNLKTIKTLQPKKTILIHIEELWQKDKKRYKKLEKQQREKIIFSYDGMQIKI